MSDRIRSHIPEMKSAMEAELQTEIEKAKKGRKSRLALVDGVRISKSGDTYVYKFEILEDKRVREDAFIKLYVPDKPDGIPGSVVSTDGQFVTLNLATDIGKEIPRAEIEEDVTELYRKIIAKLEDIYNNPRAYHLDTAEALFYPQSIQRNVGQIDSKDLKNGQIKALINLFLYKCSIVWGPPGTGKTKTLGQIAMQHVQQGQRVLLSAHANRATDNALYQVAKSFQEEGIDYEKIITRYGPLLLKGDEEIDLTNLSFEDQFKEFNIKTEERKLYLAQLLNQYQEAEKFNLAYSQLQTEIRTLKESLSNSSNELTQKIKLLKRLEDEILSKQKEGLINKIVSSITGQTLQALLDSRTAIQQEHQKIENELNHLQSQITEKSESANNLAQKNGNYENLKTKIEKEGGLEFITNYLQNEDELPAKRQFLSQFKVIASSLTKVAVDPVFKDLEFDVLVVDEASMVSLCLLFIASVHTKDQTTMIGDPQQLPPIVQADKNPMVKKWLKRDIFLQASGKNNYKELYSWIEDIPYTVFLGKQYRMPQKLSSLISKYFYEGKLEDANLGHTSGDIKIINTHGSEPHVEPGPYGRSRQNPIHAQANVDLVKQILTSGTDPGDIGVISPYKPQALMIKTLLREEKITKVEVGVIHTFQGREKTTIIFDTTDARGSKGSFWDEHGWSDSAIQLLTVAFSRAKNNLYIIADEEYVKVTFPNCVMTKILSEI